MNEKNRNILYKNFSADNKEVNIQQILKKIYSFVYHATDMGYYLDLKLPNITKWIQTKIQNNDNN